MQKNKGINGIVKSITEIPNKPHHLMIKFHLINSDKNYGHTYSDPSLGNYYIWQSLREKDHVSGLRWWSCSSSLLDGDSPIEKVSFEPKILDSDNN